MVTITLPVLQETSDMTEYELLVRRAQFQNFIDEELKVKIARIPKELPNYEEEVEKFQGVIELVQKDIDFLNKAIEFEYSKPQEQRYRELKQYQENKRNGIPGWKVPGELDFK